MAKSSVDAYGASGGKTTLLLMDPDDVHIVEDDPGSALYDPERAKLPVDPALVANIKAFGVIEPAVVRKNPDTGKVECVDGRQRTKACRIANKELKKEGLPTHWLPCVPKRADGPMLMALMQSTFLRQDESALNRARKLARFLYFGKSEDEAAVVFGISKATVKNMVALVDAPKALHKAVESGVCSLSNAYTLAKLEPAEIEKRLEKMKSEAPREPGKKRSSNGAAARRIANGTKPRRKREAEAPAVDVKALLKEVEGVEKMKEMHRAGALAALLAVLGDDKPLRELMS